MRTNLENYEERFVDYMEGQLDPSEMREVEAFVAQHPELQEDFNLLCISKLEPDKKVVFEHKEALMQDSATRRMVIPLFVRMASAAAVVAVLFGVGWHFLRPEQEPLPTEQPLIANLSPIQATGIDSPSQEQALARSSFENALAWNSTQRSKSVSQQGKSGSHQETSKSQQGRSGYWQRTAKDSSQGEAEGCVDVASLKPIRLKQLPWDGHVEYCCVESDMMKEVETRIAQLEPFGDMEHVNPDPILAKSEGILSSLGGYFFGNAHRISRSIYKQTAKTVMTAYYTADCYIDEAREKRGLTGEE